LLGPHGAHAASLPRRSRRPARRTVGLAIASSLLAIFIAAPTVGATSTTSAPVADSTIPLTVTTLDKPWYSVELFDLALVNCTRTGGWVLSDGTCRGYGSGHYSAYVRPLRYSGPISDRVSRPYAKLLAVRGLCTHYANHDPGYRLRVAGFLHYTWGENIGCRDGYASAKAAVLASHLYFQSEKSSNGGHWQNIKNAHYIYIGIGVWRYGSRTRLVNDFYA
jgi:hypothetical protein